MVRDVEKEPNIPENAESAIKNGGYSETQQSLDIEARSGDLHALKRSAGIVQQTQKEGEKTLAAYRLVSKKLDKLIEEYSALIEEDLHRGKRLLESIHKAQQVQESLFKKLIGKIEVPQETLEEVESI